MSSVTNQLPPDLSPWQMFVHADPVVQTIMVVLALASLLTWTVLLAKGMELRAAQRELRHACNGVLQAEQLADANVLDAGIGRCLLDHAQDELQRSSGLSDKVAMKERLASRLERAELAHARQLRRGTGVLATIGATAPFVGLLGTVWGIMNSFVGIAHANTTNLAVVAPGIAEALLATALGLVAAIPAVVIYNYFGRRLTAARAELGDLSAGVERLFSRDLDRQGMPGSGAGGAPVR